MIPLKSEEDLEKMRTAGKILAGIMRQLHNFVRPGVTTEEVDALAGKLIEDNHVLPAFKGYRGFPAYACISVNEEIVHGIPGARKLLDTDIVSLDLGIQYQGFFSDMAITIALGQLKAKDKRLIEVTKKALVEGIRHAKVDNRLSDISTAIQKVVEKNGFSVVRQFVGHGIGTQLHEEPEIPNFGNSNRAVVLKPGMVFAIEPMVTMGSWECRILDNGWTAVTVDGMPSAHFEHTVAITKNGPEVLTQ